MTEISAGEATADEPLKLLIKDSAIKKNSASFTIEIKTVLPQYLKKEATVVRTHPDFAWLHKMIVENPKYAGYIIPCCPPTPDFSVNRDSISAYTENEDVESEEYKKMRKELEREYLAMFKKTVNLHEAFLLGVTNIPTIRIDQYVIEFLTSTEDLVHNRSTRSIFKGMVKSFKRSIDNNFTKAFSSVHEPDRYFEEENQFLNSYHSALKTVVSSSDNMTRVHKRLSNMFIKLSLSYTNSSKNEYAKLSRIFDPMAIFIDRARKTESRISSDEDLKFSDSLRFHFWIAKACKDVLYRRTEALVASDNDSKALLKAKESNQNISIADDRYQQSLKRFESVSEVAKDEFKREKISRIPYLKSNMTMNCELQISHLKLLMKETLLVIQKLEADA